MYIRHEIGKLGEEIVTQYLNQKGYKIIERNFTCKQGGIDIICIDKKELVFIEVKTRTNDKFGKPVEAVDVNKKKHLFKAIKYYLYSRNLENEYVRIDVIEVYLYEQSYRINHIKQII